MKILKKIKELTKNIQEIVNYLGKNSIFWSTIFVFSMILLFYLIQGEIYYNLKVGDLATKDIILNKSISFIDYQETEKKKYETAQNVLPVFDFQKNNSTILIKQLEDVFKSKNKNEKIPDDVFKVFLKHSFSAELMDTISGIILQIYQNPVVKNKKYLSNFYQKGFIKRYIEKNQEEISFDVFSVLDYPKDVEAIAKIELKKVKFLSNKEKEILAEFLVEYCAPNLTLNALETNYRREKKMSEVIPISYNLPKGYTIARKGDVLNERQIAILNQMKKEKYFLNSFNYYFGIFLLAIISLIFLYKVIFEMKIKFYGYTQNSTFNLIIILNIILIYIIYFLKYFYEAIAESFSSAPLKYPEFWYLAIPFSLGAFLLRVFSSPILSLAFGIIFSLFSSLIYGHFSFFFIFALTGTIIAILSYKHIKSRWDVTKIGIFIGLGNIFSVFCFSLIFENPFSIDSSNLIEKIKALFFIAFFSFFGGLFSSMLVSFLSPIIESFSGIFSNLKLLELTSQNHPLLKELALKAPGTYQHSIYLSVLAERASDSINANSLLTKAGALFHDIGKIYKPEYFVENQRDKNPHEEFKPEISKDFISKHITKGVEFAKKNKLPRAVMDAIMMHHGTKVMHYFYHKAMDKPNGASEELFRYQGILPDTKEMSIIFLADSIEAASRTIDEPDMENIKNLVERIVEESIKDGQLKNSDLSFKEIELIKTAFEETLASMHHARIEYPNYDFNKKEKNGNNHFQQDKDKNKKK